MKRRILSVVLCMAMLVSLCSGFGLTASADDAKTPKYQTGARVMEELNRGGFVASNPSSAVSSAGGVFIGWRLLGTEPVEKTTFNIYRDNSLIAENYNKTNYIDASGTIYNKYTVAPVIDGTEGAKSEEFKVYTGAVESSWNSSPYAYFDIKTSTPPTGVGSCTYTENDASVGDVDGDGEYELILKWNPSNAKDSSSSGTTGNVYIDCYELDPNADGTPKWRIDLGRNIRAGAHYTQFQVYDYDGDGKAEMVCKTAPGSIDGAGKYVTEAGATTDIMSADNSISYVGSSGYITSGPEYVTIFEGETGKALKTIDFAASYATFGESSKYADRFLAGTAYLDGVHPSAILSRGYYKRVMCMAYDWDGEEFTQRWIADSNDAANKGLYGQGDHSLSVADLDDDGCDEIIFGSAAIDNDGKLLHSMGWGHGDSLHVSDFNNDGKQEIYGALEKSPNYGVGFRTNEGKEIWHKKSADDDGRGVMANFSESHGILAWDAAFGIMTIDGTIIKEPQTYTNSAGKEVTDTCEDNHQSYGNFNIYWDGDLLNEHYDKGRVQKWNDTYNSFGRLFALPGVSTNNDTKYNPCLQADLFGDWREELIMRKSDGGLRVFTSLIPTDYKLTTLMHDSQYRCAIAWQNTGYNQPPHTSYFVDSSVLATDSNGNTLNYLAPAVPFTNVIYELGNVPVTGLTLSEDSVTVEKGKTLSLNAVLEPSDASKRGIKWESSDEKVARVANGIVTGVGEGTATITATSKDTTNGTFFDTCEVTVYSNPVTGVTMSDRFLEVGAGYSKKLSATVSPSNATDSAVTWTSDDTSVAKVASDGTVMGVGYGKTTVTATAADGVHSAKCVVRVKPIVSVDDTGSDAFVSTTNNGDSGFSGSATGATLNLSKFTSASEVHKDFTPYNDNKVTITLNFYKGGLKENNKYIWLAGHEYNGGLKFLDAEGNVILDIYDANKNASGTGVTTMYKLADGAAKNASGWTKTADGTNSPFGRSAIRWKVTLELDYDNDLCTATVGGCADNTFVPDATYQTKFALNGASFKTIQYYTSDLTDYVTQNTTISGVSYMYETSVSGSSEALYERGYSTAWSDADLTDWVQTSTETGSLALDSTNGRIWYNVYQPGAPEYNASKAFNIAENSIVSYDVDWYFGDTTGRESNYEYIQFGSNIRLGWNSTYKVLASVDGGANYDAANALFTGEKATYTKNVKVVFDTKKKQIKSLSFDGKQIDAFNNYQLPDDATMDKMTFGFQRGGKAGENNVPTGIDRIKISQFVYGEEAPDISALTITGVEGKTVNYDYSVVNDGFVTTDYTKASIVGVLYDAEKLVEIQTKPMTSLTLDEKLSDSITFAKDVEGKTIKLMMWDSVGGLVPISEKAIR